MTGAPMSRQQWAVRVVMVLAPLVVLLADRWAGAALPVTWFGVVAALAVWAAARPRSNLFTLVLLLVVGSWWLGPLVLGAPVLLAALALVTGHVAGVVAGYGGEVDPALLRTWSWRAAGLLAVALVAWLAARLESPTPLVVAVGLGLLAALVWWAVARLGDPAREEVG